MLNRRGFIVIIVVMFVLLCFLNTSVFAEGDAFLNKAIPSFVGKYLDGTDVDINSFKGNKVVLINFWGIRCGSCIDEMPHLNVLYEKYKDQGFVILGINADGVDSDFLTGPKGMRNLPLTIKYPVIIDPDMKLVDLLKMEAAPLNVLIDKNGIVRFYHVGYEQGDEKKLEERIKAVLK